jgi:hypothetical protein
VSIVHKHATNWLKAAVFTILLLIQPGLAVSETTLATFCSRQFGENAHSYLEPALSNPSGVADGIFGSSPSYRRDAPVPIGFKCTYPVKTKVGQKPKELFTCVHGMKLEKFRADLSFCSSKLFPLKELCPDELKEYKRPGLVEKTCGSSEAAHK